MPPFEGPHIAEGRIGIDIDTSAAHASMERFKSEFRAEMADIGRQNATVKIKADVAAADIKIKELRKELALLEAKKIGLKADSTQFKKTTEDIEALKKKLLLATAKDYEFKIKIVEDRATKEIDARKLANIKERERAFENLARKESSLENELFRQQTDRIDGRRKELSLQRESKTLLEDIAKKEKEKDQRNFFGRYVNRPGLRETLELDTASAQAKLERIRLEARVKGINLPVRIDEKGLLKSSLFGKGNNEFLEKLTSIPGSIYSFTKKGPDILPFVGRLRAGAAVAAGTAGLPFLASLGGLAGGLGAGALGAGAVGGGLALGGGLNLAGLLGELPQVSEELKTVTSAQQKWHKSLIDTGAGSEKTQKALAEYKEALSNVDPPLRKAVTTVTSLQEEWHKASKPIVQDIARIVEAASHGLKPLIPTLAKNSDQTSNKLAFHTESFFGKLDANKGQIDSIEKSFNLFFGKALVGAEDFSIGLLHIGESASRLFAGPFGGWLEKLGRDFEHATEPGDKLDKTVKTLGDDAKKVGDFFSALSKVLFDLFSLSAPSGLKTLGGITEELDKWDGYLRSIEGKKNAGKFFEESAKTFRELGPIVANIGHLLGEWSVGLVPFTKLGLQAVGLVAKLLDGFAELVGFKNPMRAVGDALVVAFALHKFQPAVEATTAILRNVKETGSLSKGFGKFFSEKGNPGAQGATFAQVANADLRSGAAVNGTVMADAFLLQVRESGLIDPLGAFKNSRGRLVDPVTKKFTTEEKLAEAGYITSAGRTTKAGPGAFKFSPAAGAAGEAASVGEKAAIGGAEKAGASALGAGALEALGLTIPIIGTIAATAGIIAAPTIIKALQPGAKYNDEAHREAKEKGVGVAGREQLKQINKEEEAQLKRFENKPGKVNAHGQFEQEGLSGRERLERKDIREQFGAKKGEIAGKAEVENFKADGKNPPLSVIEKRTKDALRALPDTGKTAALSLVDSYVETLEKEGRLPKGSVEKLVRSVKDEMKDMPLIGAEGAKRLADGFKRETEKSKITDTISRQTSDIRKNWYGQFGLVAVDTHARWGEVIGSTAKDLEILRRNIKGSSGIQRKEFEEEYAHLSKSGIHYIDNTRTGVEKEITFLSSNMKLLGKKGPAELERAYARMKDVVIAEAELTGTGTGTAFAKLNKQVKKELLEIDPTFGVHSKPGGVNAGGSSGGSGAPVSGEVAATGYVQFGRGGERGTDKIHTSLAVGAGEVGAVFNHHQQAVANHLLGPVGGLHGLFQHVTQPHHQAPVHGPASKNYAKGGPVGGSHFSRMVQAADKVASYDYPYIRGGGHESPARLEPFDCSGAVSYIVQQGGYKLPTTVAQNIGTDWHLPSGRGAVSIYYKPVREGKEAHTFMEIGGRFFGTGWDSKGGAGWASAPPSAGYLSEFNVVHLPNLGAVGGLGGGLYTPIKEPKLGKPPYGYFNKIGQKALKLQTQAANKRLAAAAEAAFSSGGGGGNTGEGQAAGSPKEKAWAKAGLIAAGLKGSPHEVDLIVYTMSHESGGNPRSENTTDSNARAGHPSRGLMELIPENFSKYHVGGTSNNVFDPVANVAAAVRYMIARYGHIVGMSPYAGGGIVADLSNRPYGHMTPFARGGLYKKPALLVGEHDNEYVINPSRPDNAEHLKAAGEQMGYHVTPAAAGKGAVKSVSGANSKEEKALKFLPLFAERGGVPAKSLETLYSEIKAAVGKEETKLSSLNKQLKKAVKSKDIAKKLSHHAETSELIAHENKVRLQSEKASITLSKAQEKAAHANHAAAVGGPGDNSKRESADTAGKALADARTADGIAKKALAIAHSKTLSDLRFRAGVKDKKEAEKIANLELGIGVVHKGGVYEKEKYVALKKLKGEENSAKAAVVRQKKFENDIKGLNKQINSETHHLNILAANWSHAHDAATKQKYASEWAAAFKGRAHNIEELTKDVHTSKAAASELLAKPEYRSLLSEATKSAISTAIKEATVEEENIEDKASQSEGEAENAPGAAATSAPSGEQYVEKLGKQERLEQLNEKMALAQAAVVVDNPNTPANEELPGLEGEVAPTQELMAFWKEVLSDVTAEPGASPKTVIDIAGQFTSAKQTAEGLVNTISSDKKSQTSQLLQEAQQFGQARLELYKQYGSNFAPTLGGIKPQYPAGSSSAGGASGPAVHTPSVTNVNVTNHFTEPPPSPHHFSQNVAYELQAAI